jgi:hypothetical protein
MWYYTNYSIEAKPEIIKELRESNENANYAFDENWETNDSTKWYDSTQDVLEISKKYPNDLILLKWEWEEPWDIRREYFKWWKYQREEAKIVIWDFDENKLITFN